METESKSSSIYNQFEKCLRRLKRVPLEKHFDLLQKKKFKSGRNINIYSIKPLFFQNSYALKEIKKLDNMFVEETNAMISLYESLINLHNPHLVNIYCISNTNESMLVIQDLYERNLQEYLENKGFQKKTSVLSEAIVNLIFNNIFSALYYLYQNNLTHKNINPKSIFLSNEESGIPKFILGEPSLSYYNRNRLECCPKANSIYFFAPEFKEFYLDSTPPVSIEKADIFSLGAVLIYLFGSRIWPIKNQEQIDEILNELSDSYKHPLLAIIADISKWKPNIRVATFEDLFRVIEAYPPLAIGLESFAMDDYKSIMSSRMDIGKSGEKFIDFSLF